MQYCEGFSRDTIEYYGECSVLWRDIISSDGGLSSVSIPSHKLFRFLFKLNRAASQVHFIKMGENKSVPLRVLSIHSLYLTNVPQGDLEKWLRGRGQIDTS